jgi:DNA-binding MarR family transcriptional regulator
VSLQPRAPVSINDLASELLIRHNSAVGLADRLVANGLLVREHIPEDHRKVRLRLTPKGERVLGKLASIHRLKLQRMGPDIHRILGELTGAWRAGDQGLFTLLGSSQDRGGGGESGRACGHQIGHEHLQCAIRCERPRAPVLTLALRQEREVPGQKVRALVHGRTGGLTLGTPESSGRIGSTTGKGSG